MINFFQVLQKIFFYFIFLLVGLPACFFSSDGGIPGTKGDEKSGLSQLLKDKNVEEILFSDKELESENISSVTRINDDFAQNFRCLKKATFSLKDLKEIGDNFLNQCEKLTSIVLKTPKLEKIGAGFLEDCSQLKQLKEVQLESLTAIGKDFLEASGCEEFVLKAEQLTSIGSAFLYGCDDLKKVELEFPALTELPEHFLGSCADLKEVLLELPEVREIGKCFLQEAVELEELELKLPKVTRFGEDCFKGCKALKKLTIKAPELKHIDFSFLINSPSLEELVLDIPKFSVKTGQPCWLKGCRALKKFVLKAPLLKRIEKGFLSAAKGLKELDLRGCTALEQPALSALKGWESRVAVQLPSSKGEATLSGSRGKGMSPLAEVFNRTGSEEGSVLSNQTLPPTSLPLAHTVSIISFLFFLGSLIALLYYSNRIEVEKKKKRPPQPETLSNDLASSTSEEESLD